MNNLKKFEAQSRQWFVLTFDGALSRLGDFGDIEAADEYATDLGLEVVWMIDGDTASQWLDVLKEDAA